jgi:hypothetical protein
MLRREQAKRYAEKGPEERADCDSRHCGSVTERRANLPPFSGHEEYGRESHDPGDTPDFGCSKRVKCWRAKLAQD